MVQAQGASQQLAANSMTKASSLISTAANHNIQCQPRFLFGLKGDVKNNIFFLEDNVVCYPCGHNVVVYYMNEKMQRYIPGIEGSQGITAMGLSSSRSQIAVCEQSTNAICTVYSIGRLLEMSREKRSTTIFEINNKKRKVLCSTDDPARKFVSVAFCDKNEKLLVTASGGAEARVIIWNWEKQRCLQYCDLLPKPNQTVTQVSFSNLDPSVVVVTGNEHYRYLKQDGNALKIQQVGINRRENETYFSQNYTCHAWLPDGRFLICNDQGQILIMEPTGDYKGFTAGDPKKESLPIWAVATFTGSAPDQGNP